jgi:hypothetical protein
MLKRSPEGGLFLFTPLRGREKYVDRLVFYPWNSNSPKGIFHASNGLRYGEAENRVVNRVGIKKV